MTARPASVDRFGFYLDFPWEPGFDPVFGDHFLGRLAERLFGAVALREFLQLTHGSFQSLLPVEGIAPDFLRRAIPIKAEAFAHLVKAAGQFQTEGVHGLQDRRRQQAGAIGREETLQGAAHGVIAARQRTDPAGIPPLSPLGQAIQGQGFQEDVFDQQFHRLDIGGVVQSALQQRAPVQPVQISDDDGQGADLLRKGV